MTCLHPDHKGRPAVSRGVCKSCYVVACRAVKSGKITWEELEDDGKVLRKNKDSLEEYYSSRRPKTIASNCKNVGSFAMYDGSKVKILAFDEKKGFEIEYSESGSWIGDDIAASELTECV